VVLPPRWDGGEGISLPARWGAAAGSRKIISCDIFWLMKSAAAGQGGRIPRFTGARAGGFYPPALQTHVRSLYWYDYYFFGGEKTNFPAGAPSVPRSLSAFPERWEPLARLGGCRRAQSCGKLDFQRNGSFSPASFPPASNSWAGLKPLSQAG